MKQKQIDAIIYSGRVSRAFKTPAGKHMPLDNKEGSKFLELENQHGIVFTIWHKKHIGYQVNMPIKPNHLSGSAVGVTGDSYDGASFEQLMSILEKDSRNTPAAIYSERERESIHFLELDDSVNTHGNILGYEEIMDIKHDRDRMEEAKEMFVHPCIPVSIEYLEEMRDCVPPQFMGTTDEAGYYHMIQVGEPASHNKHGQPTYETFQMMSQRAVDSDLEDSRMVAGVWYFVGLKTEHHG